MNSLELYGRDRNKGGFMKILSIGDSCKNTLPSSDLNTFEGDRPGVFSFIENGMRFIGVVIPHPEGTPSDNRNHCLTHVVGQSISSDSIWTHFSKEVLPYFYHGSEDDACSHIDSLNPETIYEKVSKIHHIHDEELNFIQCTQLLRQLKFHPDIVYNIICEKSLEYELFKFLGSSLTEAVALNIESSCRVNVNGHPRTPFYTTLNFMELPPFELDVSFCPEEFNIGILRKKILQIYGDYHDFELKEASEFWENEKSKITTKLSDKEWVQCIYQQGLLAQTLLFSVEKEPIHIKTSSFDFLSLECLYNFSLLSALLKELPLSTARKKRLVKNIKRILSINIKF